jgi:VCPO second helical-bundle domain
MTVVSQTPATTIRVPRTPLLALAGMALALAGVLALTLATSHQRDTNAVTRWNAIAFHCTSDLGRGTRQSRVLAMMHLAIHDALNSIHPVYATYAGEVPASANASPEAAIAASAHEILVTLAREHRHVADEAYARAVSRIRDDQARRSGIAAGEAAARVILALRRDDGADEAEIPYVQTPAPGLWEPTPPAFEPPILPGWQRVTPFALVDAAQFRPVPPPALDSAEYARQYEEVRQLGAIDSPLRSAEQSEIAQFWSGDALASWNRIARTVVDDRARDRNRRNDIDLWQTARLFALINMAMADGFISGWDAKYHYRYWRPIVAIRRGDSDHNPATVADPAWTPYLVTPAHPEYPSTHSVLSAASARTLQCALGTDAVHFSVKSKETIADDARSYDSFMQAAQEVADSRLYAGAHFRIANTRGLQEGRKIGDFICNRFLQPRMAVAVHSSISR